MYRDCGTTLASYYSVCSPTPVWPTPIWPTSIWPTPLWPTSVWPTPVWPTPLWPTPVLPTQKVAGVGERERLSSPQSMLRYVILLNEGMGLQVWRCMTVVL